jgi:hypothetical protein
MEKAKRLTAEWNLDSDAGNSDAFSVLDLLPDSRLSLVITDSCVVFVPSVGSPGEALSILRAKEKVQAALAELAFRKERETAKRATREVAASSPSTVDGVGASTAVAGSGRDASPEAFPANPVESELPAPREVADGLDLPSPPTRGRPRVPRVTRSVTRAMLFVRKGKRGKVAK